MAQLADDPNVNPFWPFTNLPVYFYDNNGRPFAAPQPDETLGQGSRWRPFSNGRFSDIGTITMLLTQAFGRAPTAYEVVGYARSNNIDIVGGNGEPITSINDLPATVGTGQGEFTISVPSTHPSQRPAEQTPGRQAPTPQDPTAVPGAVTNPDIPGGGTEVPTGPSTADEVIAELTNTFSWVSEIGLDFGTLRSWIVSDGITTPEALVEKVRGTEAWKARFPEIRRGDGTLRYNESRYLAEEDRITSVLRRFGDPTYDYDDPSEKGRFIEMGADELEQRFTRYRELERTSQGVRDAFYLYTGRDPGIDTLYEALIDPAVATQLEDEFNSGASAELDYQTWISRATEVGLRRVTEELTQLASTGAVAADAVAAVTRIDPDFARQMMGAIASRGPIQWDELVSSFEVAMIGGAASDQGFELPSEERAEQFRSAGVDRARALDAYAELARSGSTYSAAFTRAFGRQLSQVEFENARLLQQGEAQAALDRAMAQEEAVGFASGGVDLGRDEFGSIVARGLDRS